MSKEQTDLLPCPFCGGSGRVLRHHRYAVTIHCRDCECDGPDMGTEDEAIAAWNRRASPSPAGGVQGVPRSYTELAVWANEVLAAFDETIGPGGMPNAIKGLRSAYEGVCALSSQAQTTGGVE